MTDLKNILVHMLEGTEKMQYAFSTTVYISCIAVQWR